jgi:hypothetical protein
LRCPKKKPNVAAHAMSAHAHVLVFLISSCSMLGEMQVGCFLYKLWLDCGAPELATPVVVTAAPTAAVYAWQAITAKKG